MKELVVIIPIYRDRLLENEIRAIDSYCRYFNSYDMVFICADNLDTADTQIRYPKINCVRFKNTFFKSNKTYNNLMLSEMFYRSFEEYKYLLIAQTDAIVFNSSIKIEDFLKLDLDYIGAPWFESPIKSQRDIRYYIKRLIIHDSLEGKCGNGGFSLRKVSSCLNLLRKTKIFRLLLWHFNEDLFFSYVGWKKGMRIAEMNVGEKFCLEQQMKKKISEGIYPLALHAWEKEFDSHDELMDVKGIR